MQLLSFLLQVAWRNLWRHRRRSLITAGAMAVGVGLCMSMIALTDGMMNEFSRLLIDEQLGHVQVHHPDYLETRSMYDSIEGVDDKLQAIDGLPDTRAASVRLFGYALLGAKEKSAGAQLVGVDPAREFAVRTIKLTAGEHLAGSPPNSVLVGAGLAETLEIEVGSELVAVTQASDGSMGNDLYIVRGIFKSGNAVLDRAGAYLHLADLQTLLVLQDQAHELTLLADTEPADYQTAVAGVVGEDLESLTWREVSPQTAQMMGMQDFSIGIIMFIVFSVTAFGILNTMMMSVFERTRELGVLKAIGLRPMRMVALIVLESVLLAGVSTAIGLVIGAALDAYLVVYGLNLGAEVEDLSFQGIMMDPQIYGAVRVWPIVACVVSVFVVSALASLYPAMRAARLEPVAAIRTE